MSWDEETGTLNLEDLNEEADEYEAVPRGDYDCNVIETVFGPSSNGNPMVTLTLEVEDDRFLESDSEAEDDTKKINGRRFWYYMVLHKDRGLKSLKRAIKICRPEEAAQILKAFNPEKDAEDVFNGARVKARVGVQMYEKKRRNNVKDLLPIGGEEFLR